MTRRKAGYLFSGAAGIDGRAARADRYPRFSAVALCGIEVVGHNSKNVWNKTTTDA
jgi:hypothetical protein